MVIILVRHGQTDYNVSGLIQGHYKISLNKSGIVQAKKGGEVLKDYTFDEVHLSPLPRAVETFNEFKIDTNNVVFFDELMERNFGVWEQEAWEMVRGLLPDPSNPWSKINYEFRPLNGESNLDLKKRVDRYSEHLLKKDIENNILIVSHGGTLKCLIASLLRVQPYDESIKSIKNCEILEFDRAAKSIVSVFPGF